MEFNEFDAQHLESNIKPDGKLGTIPIFNSPVEVLDEATTYDGIDVPMYKVLQIPEGSIGYSLGAAAEGCASGIVLQGEGRFMFHTVGRTIFADLEKILQNEGITNVLLGGNQEVITQILNYLKGKEVQIKQYPVKDPDQAFSLALIDSDEVTTQYGKPVPKGIHWYIGE